MQTSSPTVFDIRKRLFSLALPIAVVQLVMVMGGFLGMAMLSRLGYEVLAASALIYSTQTPVMVTGFSILFSLSILVGHARGAHDTLGIGRLVQQGWVLCLPISLPLMFIFWHMDRILIFFGQAEPIAYLVGTFFQGYVWGVPAVLGAVCNQQFCFGIHRQMLVALQNLLWMMVLLTIGYTLIFGKFGMPAMGVSGYGYAMTIANWFAFIFMILCFWFRKEFKPFDLFTFRVHKDWGSLKKMLTVGGHISLQVGGEMLSLMVLAAMMGWLGFEALAAYQVVTQYFFMALIPIFAISQAVGILVGQACGQKQFSSFQQLGRESVGLALLLSVTVAIIFWLFPKVLASFYFDVTQPQYARTLHLVTLMFSIMGFSLIFGSIKNLLTGASRGLLDSQFPMMVGLGVIWLIGVPLSYVLAFIFHLGALGIVIGSAVGSIIGAGMMWARWRMKMHQIALGHTFL